MTNPSPGVATGLDVVLAELPAFLRGARVGLLCHPASVTSSLEHAADALAARSDVDLVALLGPQHGIRGEKQDNMIESASFVDERTGLPVHSLYGDVRKPTPAMLDGLDVLLIDLQDVGVRVYTFVWTACLALEACREEGVRCVVLDRPNPIGGEIVEGPVLCPAFSSFVGLHPIPLRHGLTLGELALLANESFGLAAALDVVPVRGWQRGDWHSATGLPWVLPSPNLPTLDSCAVYPGTVLLEGTNLSEGRGTTRPFELVGAPWLDPHALVAALESRALPGCRLRPAWFEPTFQKHAGETCGGLQIHVTDRDVFRPVALTVALLEAAQDLGGEAFRWREPPYEYEEVAPPIDILWGSDDLRLQLAAGATPEDLIEAAAADLPAFAELARPHLLYS